MAIRRSQSNRNNRIDQTETDTFSDDDSNASFPDLYTGNLFREDNEKLSELIKGIVRELG